VFEIPIFSLKSSADEGGDDVDIRCILGGARRGDGNGRWLQTGA
jgi:hypothetical protein